MTINKFAVLLIGLGIVFRLLTPAGYFFEHGVIIYATMADSLIHQHAFVMPFGGLFSDWSGPAPSRHFPPLYPLYLAVWLLVFGYSPAVIHVAAVVLSLTLLGTVLLVFRDLYDRERALVMTAWCGVNGILLDVTGKCLSENLILLTLTVTLWAGIMGLRTRRGHYWLVAGIAAGCGFLTKAQAGPFWLGAILLGLLGFLAIRRRQRIPTAPFLGGLCLFGLISGIWLLRNYLLFGTTETSWHNGQAYAYAATNPGLWLHGIIGVGPFFLLVLLIHLGPFTPMVRTLDRRNPETIGLGILGFFLFGSSLVITGAVWTYEGEFLDVNSTRYLIVGILPLTWLFVSHARFDRPGVRSAIVGSLLVMLAGGCVVMVESFIRPEKSQVARKDIWAAERLTGLVRAGDCVEIRPEINKNQFLYYYLRLKDRPGVGLFHDRAGRTCRFLVCYGRGLQPVEPDYRLVEQYYDGRVSIWEHVSASSTGRPQGG